MTQAHNKKSPHHSRILLAEDDPVLQMVTTRVLTQAAYLVDVVTNGLEVLNALKSKDYDLVLMDGLMPEMDGFEATRVIRGANSGVRQPEIPIIALTALNSAGDRELCIQSGMNDYLDKPVDPDLLISAIEQWLEKSSNINKVACQQEVKGQSFSNDDFMDTIIDRFLEDVPLMITELKHAISKGDIKALKNIGHRIRGAADVLGASALSSRSRALERAAKTGDMAPANQCATELIGQLKLLMVSSEEE